MTKAKRWMMTPLLVLFAVWAVLFYQLVFRGLALDYSFYGAAIIIIASIVFMFAFPKSDRTLLIRFTLFCLAVAEGVASFAGSSPIWRVIDSVVLIILALVIGRLLMKVRVMNLLIVSLALIIMQLWIPLSDMSVLSAFSAEYIGHLESQDPQIPSVPVATIASVHRPGLQTIITLVGHKPVKGEAQDLIDLLSNPADQASVKPAIEELQHSYDVIAITPGKLRYHEQPAQLSQLKQLPNSTFGLIDFPFTTAHFININGDTRMYVKLSQTPGQLLSLLLNPASLADSIGALGLQTASSVESNWAQITGHKTDSVDGLSISGGRLVGSYHGSPVNVGTTGVAILGVHQLLPASASSSPQAIVEGNNVIQVITLPPQRPRVIATLRGSYLYPLTTDIVFGDLTGQHFDEMLVNTVPAQVLQLTPDGSWKQLWVSGRPSFRFETIFPQSGGDLIIANSPSYVNPSPTRYLGGYKYADHALQPVFRVYHGDLVDLHTVYVNSPSSPELLSSLYSHQEIMLLAPSRIPWVPLVEAIYGFIVVIGLIRRVQRRRTA